MLLASAANSGSNIIFRFGIVSLRLEIISSCGVAATRMDVTITLRPAIGLQPYRRLSRWLRVWHEGILANLNLASAFVEQSSDSPMAFR
jgi:hypothetical protein